MPRLSHVTFTSAITMVLLVCLSLQAYARPFNTASFGLVPNAKRSPTKHLPPAGSDTYNPGTLSHPVDLVVSPAEAIVDDENLDLFGLLDFTSLKPLSELGGLSGGSGSAIVGGGSNAVGITSRDIPSVVDLSS
ncbi:hypothetical protein BJ138DRAFT_1177051 [Hygrophoropsis aurantiaca]|uniref:Uncharacterized protein n=1 Tax=Hygrophoropsis aurantiaca TaxID=72124 RepID=A0ACB8AN93_9AGAM|nr:hypothetical protein BJ138DRAFT_1177051 [Hygrophoropsis aurantiaca]